MNGQQIIGPDASYILSMAVLMLGLFVILVLVALCLIVLRRDSVISKEVGRNLDQFTEGRRELWIFYGQLTISALVILLVTVLLLSGKISSEAGLPILSGVSGFAIAKSTDSRAGRPREDGRTSETGGTYSPH